MPEEQKLQLTKTVALVGLMGCGKSTVGRRLARVLQLPFIDLDNHIEDALQMSVSAIFEKYGEAYFRNVELLEAKKIIAGEPVILATGGGAFINDEIRKAMQQNAISVWINADLETLLERVLRRNTRPLLENGDKRQILKDLIDKRYPIYSKADIEVNSTNGSQDEVVNKIIEALHECY